MQTVIRQIDELRVGLTQAQENGDVQKENFVRCQIRVLTWALLGEQKELEVESEDPISRILADLDRVLLEGSPTN